MLAPILRAAAEQYPDTEFTMLSQQRFADLFAGMPTNVKFHGVDLKKQSLPSLTSALGSYDGVADMHGVIRSIFVSAAMLFKGAKVASIHKGRGEKRQLTKGKIHCRLKHTTERYADVFAALGMPLSLPSPANKNKGNGIGIAPFAAHPGKVYPIERMERVVELLSQKGERIVLFGGGKKEKEVLNAWAAKYPNVESIAGKLTLAEELEVMRTLRVMLTMDSGNMHLASLVGTRVISIWGATHPYAGFLGYGQREDDCIQRDLPCRPCSVYGNKPCIYGDYRCMDISPEEIVERLME